MKHWLCEYRDLPINVVFLAQDRAFNIRDEDDNDDDTLLVPEVGPALTQSVAQAMNALVSVIGNTFIRMKTIKKEVRGKKVTRKEPQYCLRIGPNPLYATKVRNSRDKDIPSFLINPTYEDILSIIKGK
jgi:hypothetical protein